MPQAAGRVDALAIRHHRSRRSFMTSRPTELHAASLDLPQVFPMRAGKKQHTTYVSSDTASLSGFNVNILQI
jgi:hypothetical protein